MYHKRITNKVLWRISKEGEWEIIKNIFVLETVLTGWKATMVFHISINTREKIKSLAMKIKSLAIFEPLL